MGIPDHLIYLLRNLYACQETTVRTRCRTMDCFQTWKGVCQSCILLPCLLTYMQSTWSEMLDWMKHKLELRLHGEISITSDMQMTTIMAESKEELKSLLMKAKEDEWKSWLKTQNIQKPKIMTSSSITSWQIDGEKWKQWQILFSWAPKSLWTVTAAILEDALLVKKSYDQPRQHIKKQTSLCQQSFVQSKLWFSQ